MTGPVQRALSLLAVAFTAYLAVGALLWTGPVTQPMMLLAAVALYLVTTWVCLFWPAGRVPPRRAHRPGHRHVLPAWIGVLALATAAVIPSATWIAVGPSARSAAFATWTLGGVGALMVVVMVRRRPWIAWAGVVVASVQGAVWLGVPAALERGVVGTVVWVGTAQLLQWLIDRTARDTAELTRVQQDASQWLATQAGRRRTRRVHVQRALAVAGPVLARVIETGGALDEGERAEARLAEAALRDELRGARLLDDAVRARLDEARRRGATVTVLDEGGLDALDGRRLDDVRARLAAALADAASDRIYVRTSPHERIAVTVVGRSRDDTGGDDTVDLWEEIAHSDE